MKSGLAYSCLHCDDLLVVSGSFAAEADDGTSLSIFLETGSAALGLEVTSGGDLTSVTVGLVSTGVAGCAGAVMSALLAALVDGAIAGGTGGAASGTGTTVAGLVGSADTSGAAGTAGATGKAAE